MLDKNRLQYAHYCNEPIENIEGYDRAVNDMENIYFCHHRDEVKELPSGMKVFRSRKELIEDGRYYDCPAAELIFLTKSEHSKLHRTGKKWTDEVKTKMSKQHNLTDDVRNANKERYKGKTWKLVDGKRVWMEVN